MKLADLGDYKVESKPEPPNGSGKSMKLSDLGEFKIESSPAATADQKGRSGLGRVAAAVATNTLLPGLGGAVLGATTNQKEKEAFTRGAAQTASFGLIDEATAGLGAAIDVGAAALGKRGDISFGDAYRTRRDAIRKADDKSAAEDSGLYGAGTVGGAALGVLAPGLKSLQGARAATEVGGFAAKALPPVVGSALVRRMGKEGLGRAVIASGQGAVAGAGMSKADVTKGDVAGVAKDALFGSAIATGAQVGADRLGAALGGVAKSASGWLDDVAANRAFKAATGNQGKVYQDAVKQGRVTQVGNEILDSNTLRPIDVVNPLRTPAKAIAERAEEKAGRAWTNIEKTFADIDQRVPNAVDTTPVRDAALKRALQIESPNTEAEVANLLRQGGAFEKKGAVSLAETQRLKNTYPFNPQDPFNVSGTMKRGLMEAQEKAVERHAGAEALAQYKRDKQLYGSLVGAEKAAEGLATREAKNRTFSLTDNILGAAQLKLDPSSWPKALATAVGNKALRERGSAAAAITADGLASVLKSAPQTFGKFAPELQRAAARSPEALEMTHTILLESEPAYRAILGLDPGDSAVKRRLQKQAE